MRKIIMAEIQIGEFNYFIRAEEYSYYYKKMQHIYYKDYNYLLVLVAD
jgi:hypothetical protein